MTKIQLNLDYSAKLHCDKNNLGPSSILGWALPRRAGSIKGHMCGTKGPFCLWFFFLTGSMSPGYTLPLYVKLKRDAQNKWEGFLSQVHLWLAEAWTLHWWRALRCWSGSLELSLEGQKCFLCWYEFPCNLPVCLWLIIDPWRTRRVSRLVQLQRTEMGVWQ